jgi:4'-phosphopantetheinyl transferase
VDAPTGFCAVGSSESTRRAYRDAKIFSIGFLSIPGIGTIAHGYDRIVAGSSTVTLSPGPTLAFPSVDALTGGPGSPVTLSSSGIVDLWSCTLEGSGEVLARCHASLSEDERVRAARFIRSEDQTAFVLAHGALRAVLARYRGVEPAGLRFQIGPTGKPRLLGEPGRLQDLRFNLSHSHGRMLMVVAHGMDVGVDLEQVRGNLGALQLAERFYTATEYESIKSQPSAEQAQLFYHLWVAKEAVLKAQGIGIPSLQQCEIVVSSVPFRADVRVMPDSAVQQGWTIQWLSCGSGWRGAVSAFGNGWSVRVLDGGCG